MSSPTQPAPLGWQGGPGDTPVHDAAGLRRALCDTTRPVYMISTESGPGVVTGGTVSATPTHQLLAAVGPIDAGKLGSADFRSAYNVRAAYMAGAMANGIASVDLVVALANAGYLASYGAAGQLPQMVAEAVDKIRSRAPGATFAVNVIHSPNEPALENGHVDVLLDKGVRVVEASAFMNITAALVRYRLSGARRAADGSVETPNKIIAKVSRTETAAHFLAAPPKRLVDSLVASGAITQDEADLAPQVRMADDITAEGDSGGHTDRRPLLPLVQMLLRLRDSSTGPGPAPRIGAAGGLGSPQAIAAAFAAGAEYMVTGSVNQACVESGTSTQAKAMLATASLADFAMAPAADMLEIGAELQVLRKGTFFPQRGTRLAELYRTHGGVDELSDDDRRWLEETVLRGSIDQVWEECKKFFGRRDPAQLRTAEDNPKKKMALIFRWYLGLASRWANIGDPERTADYQIWSGPAMGDFNSFVAGTHLATPENRRVAEVAELLMRGAAVHTRMNLLRAQGGTTISIEAKDLIHE